MHVSGSDYASGRPSNLWGFIAMEDLFTERRVADRRAGSLPLLCTTRRSSARALCTLALGIVACSHSVPSIGGEPAVSPAPGTPYTAPRGVVPPEPDSSKTQSVFPPDIAPRDSALALPDVVDVALRNNPQTSLSWFQARTAAFQYGSARATYFPTIDASASLARSQSTTSTGFVQRT